MLRSIHESEGRGGLDFAPWMRWAVGAAAVLAAIAGAMEWRAREADALTALETIRPTDPQKADSERLRADIQRQLLALTSLPATPPDREKGDRRLP